MNRRGETHNEYNRQINAELTIKRREFGLETDYNKLDEKWKTLFWEQFSHMKPPKRR